MEHLRTVQDISNARGVRYKRLHRLPCGVRQVIAGQLGESLEHQTQDGAVLVDVSLLPEIGVDAREVGSLKIVDPR